MTSREMPASGKGAEDAAKTHSPTHGSASEPSQSAAETSGARESAGFADQPLRIAIGHLATLVSLGLLSVLSEDAAMEIVGTDLDLPCLVAAIDEQAARVVILDEEWAITAVLKALLGAHPTVALVVLAHNPNPQAIIRLINVGVAACLSTDTSPNDMRSALKRAAAGEQILLTTPGLRGKRGAWQGAGSLTPREREVVRLIASQQSRAAIALALGMSEHTEPGWD